MTVAQVEHVTSAQQFNPDNIEEIFDQAAFFEHKLINCQPIDCPHPNGRNAVVTSFYEPSTRTRLSFEAAASYLGLPYLSTENAKEFSSAVKGERIEDTVKTVARYAANGAIVIRHGEKGALDQAAEAGTEAGVPIISAGDGDGEHPTQALLDLYTINKFKGKTEGLGVVIGGDLLKGRTARSLALLLSQYRDNHITFVSLPELSIGDDIKDALKEAGTAYTETDDMHGAVREADVVYWTRLQLERHGQQPTMGLLKRIMAGAKVRKENWGLHHNYVIDSSVVDTMEDDTIIMHPLPRNNEIDHAVDTNNRARYFDQVESGIYIRMALLDKLIRAANG